MENEKKEIIEANNVSIYTTSNLETEHNNPEPKNPTKHKKKISSKSQNIALSKKSFAKNFKKNINKSLLKTLGFGIIGGVGYALVPTVLQAVTKNDWSGYKGLITGVTTMSAIGLATNHNEMMVGAVCASGAHLTYSKFTGVIEKTLNTEIFRMNRQAVGGNNQLLDATDANKQLSDSYIEEELYPEAQSIDELIKQLSNN